MFDALARLADGHARGVRTVALLFFFVAIALGSSVAQRLNPYGAEDPSTDSIIAKRELQAAGYREPGIMVLIQDAPIAKQSTRSRIELLERRLRQRTDVASVTGYYDTKSKSFVSHNGDSTYLLVALKATGDKQQQKAATEISQDLTGVRGVIVGGPAVAQEQVNSQVEKDLKTAELLVFPLLFLLSLFFFRSVVAALLPLMIGGLAIAGAVFILRIASEFTSVSIFALNLTTALGLGLAIDYGLFMVSRYREEIAKDGPGIEAMRRVMATAGRTVFFSSITVAAALAALLIFPQRFLYSMGLGGSVVAIFAAAVSLTVLPAVLTLLGTRVNALAPGFLRQRAEADARTDEQGAWYRFAQFVMNRPLRIAAVSGLFLIVAGLPFLRIQFNTVNPNVLPSSASARQVYSVVSTEFPPYHETPIIVAVKGGSGGAARAVDMRVRRLGGIASTTPPTRLSNDVSVISAYSRYPFLDQRSRGTVERIRRLPTSAGSNVRVTGATAEFIDFQGSLERHLPAAVGIIVVATLIILFLMTGSLILPVKALIMNLLNLSAVFGLLVLIFQDGRFEGLLSYTGSHGIEQTIPILLFAISFGLSTDYAVFLLSRIKEARDRGASDRECVAIGLERTGRIITAAALLLAVALFAFATSKIIFIKENGIGAALAVLIDASVIRMLLVPSLMALLGKWNWWAPRPLRRLHERIGIADGGQIDMEGDAEPGVYGRYDESGSFKPYL